MIFYELVDPTGKRFYAAAGWREEPGLDGNEERILEALEGPPGEPPVVLSTRTGKWEVDNKLSPADLVMPIYEMNEWDVKEIDVHQLPAKLQAEFKALPPDVLGS